MTNPHLTTLISVETKSKPPHIAICVPSGDMKDRESAICLRDLRDFAKQHFLISDVDATGSDVVSLRNLLLVGTRETDAEWCLFIDSDWVGPPDTLHRLFMHQKDIVGATYVRRAGNNATLGAMKDGEDIEQIWLKSGLIEMAHMPFGCILVKYDVFRKFDKPHFRHLYDIQPTDNDLPGHITSEDNAFCQRAIEQGFQIWCDVDLSKQTGHRGLKTFFWNDR